MTVEGILVYAENYSGRVNPATFELLGKANELKSNIGGRISATVLVDGSEIDVAKELIAYGADTVIVYKVPNRELLANQLIHRDAVVNAINTLKPKLVLINATPWGRSLGPRIAAKLKTGITADCLDVYVDEHGDIVQVRPAFTGNIVAHIKTVTHPVIATIRPKVFSTLKPDRSRVGDILVKNLDEVGLSGDTKKIKVCGVKRVKEVKISEAQVIVTVGRGLKSKEDMKIFKELANALSGELGCSKPLVDIGWCEKDRQVGFSGNIVKPRIYIACGISGAPQHIAGMKDSEYVVAINIDETAPISRYCDAFIVGDMQEIILKILDKLKKIQGLENK
ncbi:MAG: electron transfer flavoprotein subunit alpha/FixB family protein [Ignisphaera sp.]|uniref:Electron transfer flavoprotein subunit alpha/FixB family protein n=1 Tax=Ignisphaera aggregans TaxID=334771 RepID=A0A7C4NPD6_9CREN